MKNKVKITKVKMKFPSVAVVADHEDLFVTATGFRGKSYRSMTKVELMFSTYTVPMLVERLSAALNLKVDKLLKYQAMLSDRIISRGIKK